MSRTIIFFTVLGLALTLITGVWAQCQGLTFVTEELKQKAIDFAVAQSEIRMNKECIDYRLYPFYDLDGNLVTYELLCYFGEGNLPSDDDLLNLLSQVRNEEKMSKKTQEQIFKEVGITDNYCKVMMSNCYELPGFMTMAEGQLPTFFYCFENSKERLEKYLNINISKENYKGITRVEGSGLYAMFEVSSGCYYVMVGYPPIKSREEILDEIKQVNEVYPSELFQTAKERWEDIKNADSSNLQGLNQLLPETYIISDCPEFQPYIDGICYATSSSNCLSYYHNKNWTEDSF